MPSQRHAWREHRGPRDDGLLTRSDEHDERDRPAHGLVDHFFRHEYGRLVSTLTRVFGARHLEAIEDAVQSAMLSALTPWSLRGLPDDPSAWLYRAAHNRMLDEVRRRTGRTRILERSKHELAVESDEDLASGEAVSPRFSGEVADDLLRMLFVCCAEEIPEESRLVLALKTLCGFSTEEIARRLFTSEANVQKRLSRARDRLRELAPELDTPPVESLRARMPSVHAVLYLMFNEGYLSAQQDQVVRRELCDEALRLGEVLAAHPVGAVPETFALLALMCFHASRLEARIDPAGNLVLLEDQDRHLWDRALIERGREYLFRSASGERFTRYHAEAAIAGEHCTAPTYAEVRWGEIAELYEMLERISPSPLYTLNRAIAVAESRGAAEGLALLRDLVPPPWLEGFYLWDAVLGDLHRRAGDRDAARRHLERAKAVAPTAAERELLGRKLATLDAPQPRRGR